MATVADLINAARANLGLPYQYGAAGPHAYDCSGLTMAAMRSVGISLPHRSEDQAKMGTAVDKNAIQPGDLVFSDWGDGPNSHVGIAVSPNQIIDAPHTGAVVRYDDLGATYRQHITAVRRFPLAGGTAAVLTAARGGIGDAAGGLLSLAIPQEVKDFFVDANKAVTGALWWFNPTHIVRVVSGLAGGVCILAGILFLSREVRS